MITVVKEEEVWKVVLYPARKPLRNRFSKANDVITMVKEEELLRNRCREANDVITMVKEDEPLRNRCREANGVITTVNFHQLETLTSQGFVKSNINSYIMKTGLLSWSE